MSEILIVVKMASLLVTIWYLQNFNKEKHTYRLHYSLLASLWMALCAFTSSSILLGLWEPKGWVLCVTTLLSLIGAGLAILSDGNVAEVCRKVKGYVVDASSYIT